MADRFIGVYPVSKTLRFELIPIGKTLEYIERDGILDGDMHRAESYQKVKKIIDRYHKAFIDEALSGLQLENLQDYFRLYQISSRDEKQEKEFEDIQAAMRKQIVRCFAAHPKHKTLFQKELIKEELVSFTADNPQERRLVEEFYDFTTYFTGFYANRQNMYSDEKKSTAIAYRVVHQNLPKYIDNIKTYESFKECGIYIEEKELLAVMDQKIQLESIEELFKIEGFRYVLTQKGIEAYNLVLGGYVPENEKNVQGLNQYVNLYNQNSKEKYKLPKFKFLYKQILSDRESSSFVLEKYERDQEVSESVQNFYTHLCEKVIDCNGEPTIQKLIGRLHDYDLAKVYIANDTAITDISQHLYSDWSILKKAISNHYDLSHTSLKATKKIEKYEELKAKELKRQKVYSISKLNEIVEEYTGESCRVENYFISQIEEKVAMIQESYRECTGLLSKTEEKELCKNQTAIVKLKSFLDSIKELQQLVRPLLKGQEEAEKDELFYVELIRLTDEIEKVNSLYNRVRNYVTKKPYSTEKVKLNFNKSTLLDGWDVNKEKSNLGMIFLKNDCYYLGIMNSKSNRVLEDAPAAKTQNVYQKMEYKLLPGANKMLPKVFFSKSRIDEFAPDEELIENYRKGTHKKGENFSLEDCHKLIDFFKSSIEKHEDWSKFDFHFSETKTYEDISGFYREVEQQGYKITFKDIDADYIDDLVENGQLYFFQIYNKDFSPCSKGKPNLHTIYWRMIFSPENLENVIYKLNGQAEVFYRKKSIEEKDIIKHKAEKPIKNKYPASEKASSIFQYDLIKDKRYTVDKFQFHVPITMNYKAQGTNYFNRRVREQIHESKDIHIIGIDRGERNLLYLSVIDQQGNIKEQFSINEIVSGNSNGSVRCVDYQLILDNREKENKRARQNWQTINTIKELKEGYLSQAIHVIVEMMIKYNAIIVLEDLNFGFMRSRQKFEKQIYQKFEKMLIDKLNYLVDKNLKPDEIGGALKAYQLTDKFESFQKLGKQSGFLFYVPAWNTSKMDPTTGFVNLFDTRYETKERSQEFISKFKTIHYNEQENYFEYSFVYSDFTGKAEGTRMDWCLCTEGDRLEKRRNPDNGSEWEVRRVNLTEEFICLFEQYQIAWKEGDIKTSILRIEEADFYRKFMHLLSLVLQMRNSDSMKKEDWVISPVKNKKGEFFRTSPNDSRYPYDADANGAYNIARKGLWVVEQIQKADRNQLDKVKLAISNKEWLVYAQEHTV